MDNSISAVNRSPSISPLSGLTTAGLGARSGIVLKPKIGDEPSSASSVLDQISRQWTQLNSRLQTRIAQMGGPNKELLQIQTDVNSLNLTTQAATQLGEGLSQTVKRLAQVTGN
jgi:hypothetical protein